MQQLLRRVWANEFVKGGAVLTAASFLSNASNYFFNLFAARGLGPAGFGEITTFVSYSVILSIPLQIIAFVVIQKIGAKSEHNLGYAVSILEWSKSKVIRWWYLLLPFLALMPFTSRLTNLSEATALLLFPFLLLTFLTSFYTSLLQGLKFFVALSVIGTLAIFIKLAGAILVLNHVDGVMTILTFLIASAVFSAVAFYATLRDSARRMKVSVEKIERRIVDVLKERQIIITGISIVAITILSNIDIIYAKKFLSSVDAGIYSAWNLSSKIILYLTGPVSMVTYIFFAQKSSESKHEKVFLLSLATLAVTVMCSLIGYTYFSPLLIHILFGAEFTAITPYFPQAALFGSMYAGITFMNSYFIAKNSRLSLLLGISLPVYFASLLLISKTLPSLIGLNVYFSLGVLVLYLIAYTKTFIYNRVGWIKK